MIIGLMTMTSLRWIEEHEGGEDGEDDDVDGVHHQPGHQQPPGPFLESKDLAQEVSV